MNMEIEMKDKVIYAIGVMRVSSTKQGLQGDSPEQQKELIERRREQFSALKHSNIIIKKWFKFIESASGQLEQQPILQVLEYCKDPKNKVKYLFIKSIDRQTRGGGVIYGQLKAMLSKYGVQLVDTYGVIGTDNVNTLEQYDIEYEWSNFSPTWIIEFLEAERGKSEVRDILTRMIGAEIRYVRMGYRVRPAPPGFVNEKIETPHGMRVILKPHQVESPWFIRMFELRVQGNLTDEQAVKEVNKMGYKSRKMRRRDPLNKSRITGHTGENPLTVKQFQRYITNPIYAGVNTEKWLNGVAVKLLSPGLVSVATFNKANRGKITILEEGGEVKVIKGSPKPWQLVKKKENPLYPFKQQILCSDCRKPLLGSSPRSKSGKHIPIYHCNRGHKYWGINAGVLDMLIESFVSKIHFSDSFRMKFTQMVLEDLENREKRVSEDTINISQVIAEKEQETHEIKERIKVLTSPATIKMMEADIDKLLIEKASLMEKRNEKEDEQVDILTAINYCNYYMEHLEELILGSEDPMQNAAMFGLVFNSPPTYEELKNGTPNLAYIFKLNQAYQSSNSLSVSRQGIEP